MARFSTLDQQLPDQKRQQYERSYHTARVNLLCVVIFTIINVLLLVFNADVYFSFSAFIPYFIATTGMFICGRFPEDYYTDGLENMTFLNDSVFAVLVVVAVVITLVYLLAWIMSGKHRVGWIIFALVIFGIDTVLMLALGGFSLDTVLDIFFHGWVIVSLILGIVSHYNLKKLPAVEEDFNVDALSVEQDEGDEASEKTEKDENSEDIQSTEEKNNADPSEPKNSNVIRVAAKDVKHRIFLQKHMFSYDICYRRVKHTNELIINGNVYDEIEGVIEYPHTLKAWIDGHYIVAGYDGVRSYINVDGNNVAKKVRLY